MSQTLYTGDLEADLELVLSGTDGDNNPVPVDVTTAAGVRILGKRGDDLVFDRAPTSTTVVGDTSVVTMAWQTGDTDLRGRISLEVEVMWPGSRPQTFRANGGIDIHPDFDQATVPGDWVASSVTDTSVNAVLLTAGTARATVESIGFRQGLLAQGIPSYAPTTALNPYDATHNVYNFTPENTRALRTGLMRAAGGGKMNILAIGDSFYLGSDATTHVEANQIPRRAGNLLASRLGVSVAGPGMSLIQAASNVKNDRWTTTGTVNMAAGRGYVLMSAGSTATYTATVTGTSVDVYYFQSSTAFSYTIDGGSAINVAAGDGSTTVTKHTTASLSDTNHTIVVSAATTSVFLVGVAIHKAAGVAVHSIAYGGSRANSGGPTNSWTDTSNLNSINNARRGAWTASGITPDLVLVNLGGNDASAGDSAATHATGITTIKSWFPTSTIVLTHHWGILNSPTPATWETFTGAKYTLADTLNVPLVDWLARAGHAADAITAGWIADALVHPTHSANIELGRTLGDLLTN